jgi:energy-coupling factor transporter ATP-binding protein EcfA2
MADPVTVGITAATATVKLAKEVGLWERMTLALQRKHSVLVLGATGAGKTQFIDSLTMELPPAIDYMNRTEFVDSKMVLLEKHPFIFIDTPGQIEHRSRREEKIRDVMKLGVDGIINVVSYGYHESRAVGINTAVQDGRVADGFLEQQREHEINRLYEWVPLIGHKDTAKWMITVVTKADLWWDRHDEVLVHYTSGAYYEALGEAKSLHPVVLEYCSTFHKFYGQVSLSGSFDDADRLRVRSHFLQQVLSASAR